MRRTYVLLAIALLIVATLLAPPPTQWSYAQGAEPEEMLLHRLPSQDNSQGDVSGTPDQGVALNMTTVGTNSLSGRGFNADVWVHKNHAYVGQWGFGDAQHPDRCPSGGKAGVRVINVVNPAAPTVVSTLVNPPQTTAEDVQVLQYSAGPFKRRDIAMVGIQACFRTNPATKRGLQLFDVTDPTQPVELGFLDTGMAARGVHEFWAYQRNGRVYALLAVPFSMLRDTAGRGDVRIADVTDPTKPVEIADWSSDRTLGLDNFDGFGCFPFNFAHATFANKAGTLAFISHWDIGVVILDISNPKNPVFIGRTIYPPRTEGDGHSLDLTEDEDYLLLADEVIPPNSNCQAPDKQQTEAWGFLRIYSLADLANPQQVASFKTPHSTSPNRQRKGDYSIHNPFVVGNKVFIAWYSDGVRVVDITVPTNPLEVSFLVPPATKDPLHVLPFAPEVWGVVRDSRGCIYLSDMNFGLLIVKENGVGCGN